MSRTLDHVHGSLEDFAFSLGGGGGGVKDLVGGGGGG